jgi:hypothetical protein
MPGAFGLITKLAAELADDLLVGAGLVRGPVHRRGGQRRGLARGVGEEAVTMLGLPAPAGWSPERDLTIDQRIALLERTRDHLGLWAAAGTERSTMPGGSVTLRGLITTADGTAVSRRFPWSMSEAGSVPETPTPSAWSAARSSVTLLRRWRSSRRRPPFVKQSIAGDINIASAREVEDALADHGQGRLRR